MSVGQAIVSILPVSLPVSKAEGLTTAGFMLVEGTTATDVIVEVCALCCIDLFREREG